MTLRMPTASVPSQPVGLPAGADQSQGVAQPPATPATSTGAVIRQPSGYRPFLDPLALHEWWYPILVPVSLCIALAYKAVRIPTMRTFWREVLIMTGQITLGMMLLALGAWLLLSVVLPIIVPMAA